MPRRSLRSGLGCLGALPWLAALGSALLGAPSDLRFEVNGVPFSMIEAPAGSYVRQSHRLAALRKMTLTNSYWILSTEVSRAQWRAIMARPPSGSGSAGAEDGVLQGVTWAEADAFCRELGRAAGVKVSLPTLAEWQWARLGGATNGYPLADETNQAEMAHWRRITQGVNAWGMESRNPDGWEWLANWEGEFTNGAGDPPMLPGRLDPRPDAQSKGGVRFFWAATPGLDGTLLLLPTMKERAGFRFAMPAAAKKLQGLSLTSETHWLRAFRREFYGLHADFTAAKRAGLEDAAAAALRALESLCRSQSNFAARDEFRPWIAQWSEPVWDHPSVAGLGKSETLRVNGVDIAFRHVPAGVFRMGEGSDPRARSHPVALTKAFLMSETPVTQEQWNAVFVANPSKWKGPNRPVENVTWAEAKAWASNASKRTGRALRLPTEAEWEWACRAGSATAFSCGEKLTADQARFDFGKPTFEGTTNVGSFAPNAFGLYDMHGNVAQFCEDAFLPYDDEAELDPRPVFPGGSRVTRGGSWATPPDQGRSAARGSLPAHLREGETGFRLVMDVEESSQNPP